MERCASAILAVDRYSSPTHDGYTSTSSGQESTSLLLTTVSVHAKDAFPFSQPQLHQGHLKALTKDTGNKYSG